jgi:FkbM family methyltransferase
MSPVTIRITDDKNPTEKDEFIKWSDYNRTKLKSNSQNLQDMWAMFTKYKAVGDCTFGYFVEFGATNGIDGSNTLLLEKEFGWKGILAEPNPVWLPELRKNRNAFITHQCVSVLSDVTVPFTIASAADLSTMAVYSDVRDEHFDKRQTGKTIEVETITLYDLLEQAKAPKLIDYLSIDTEGSEFDILEKFFGTNYDRFQIRAITVEHNFVPGMREKLDALLTRNHYVNKFPEISRWDSFYVRNI